MLTFAHSDDSSNSFRYRRTKNHHAPTKMVKFQEGFWRGMFYTVACFVGYYTLYDEPYLYVPHCTANATTP